MAGVLTRRRKSIDRDEIPPDVIVHDDFRPSTAGWAARFGVLGSVAVLVLWLGPVVLLGGEEWFALSLAAIYAIVGLSLNVLIGYVGTISLGHQAFVGIGAFASAYVVTEMEQPFLVGVALAALIGAFQAMLLGGLALRVTGLYFALITLSYGLFAQDTLFGIQSVTGGGAGREAPLPTGPDNFAPYYFICLAFLAGVLFVDWRMMQTKAGRALLALRENPRVAATFGINVRAYTVLGFGVAGLFAGIGGALLAHLNGFVDSTEFSFQLALVFVLMTVVGGLRNRTGIIIGSAFFALLDLLIRKVPGLEHRLADLDVTIPVVLAVAGLVLAVLGGLGRHWIRAGIGVAIGLVGILILSPMTVPVIENQINEFPILVPETFALVVGPVLLLVTLVMYPGGIGQQIRPIQHWLSGHKFDIHVGGEADVQITDVRA
ncbi:MAG TPA: branched-chain amino acid ABC transporter permease [Acidimicrobiales bacterium]|nr:branched-chain amino acid ABC transporter permease [Acidimicrobiales bacterium]